MATDPEKLACTPRPLHVEGFNRSAFLPYGVTVGHIRSAMQDFLDFLGFVNSQLITKKIPRLESFLMSANFSSIVGEFMTATIPKYCSTIVKNYYHNGHPDLIPKGIFKGDSILHGEKGIEVKASRYMKAWQGHNPEDVFLVVFVFDSNRAKDEGEDVAPVRFTLSRLSGRNSKRAIGSILGDPQRADGRLRQALRKLVWQRWKPTAFTATGMLLE